MRGDSSGASAPTQQIIFDPTALPQMPPVPTHAAAPGAPEPGARPGPAQSEFTQPQPSHSEFSQPEFAEPEASQSEFTRPEFAEPEAFRPRARSRGQSRETPGQRPMTVGDIAGLVAERPRPGRGWRAAVHRASGGRLNPGESAAERDERELLERIRRPVIGDYRVAVLSVKGGVGKTSTTIGLGATFASLRGDRVIAIDANPDFGTLAHRVPEPNPATVRDLLRAPSTDRYAEVRAYTTQAPSRLEVLGSERDPSISEAFSAADYDRTLDILRRHYNILLTDCGTGIVHGTVGSILAQANCLVLVATPALDGARSAWATLDWLSAHGWADLVSSTVVVVNQLTDAGVDADSLRDLFGQRCRAVQVIPHDPHIARGADVDIEMLKPATQLAYRELAAMIADDFAQPGGRHR